MCRTIYMTNIFLFARRFLVESFFQYELRESESELFSACTGTKCWTKIYAPFHAKQKMQCCYPSNTVVLNPTRPVIRLDRGARLATWLNIESTRPRDLERRHVLKRNKVALLVIAWSLDNLLQSPFFALVSGLPWKCSCKHIDSWCCAYVFTVPSSSPHPYARSTAPARLSSGPCVTLTVRRYGFRPE